MDNVGVPLAVAQNKNNRAGTSPVPTFGKLTGWKPKPLMFRPLKIADLKADSSGENCATILSNRKSKNLPSHQGGYVKLLSVAYDLKPFKKLQNLTLFQ